VAALGPTRPTRVPTTTGGRDRAVGACKALDPVRQRAGVTTFGEIAGGARHQDLQSVDGAGVIRCRRSSLVSPARADGIDDMRARRTRIDAAP
jgi:hypothetical protein